MSLHSRGSNNPFYGRTHTDKTKDKLSLLLAGKTGEGSRRWIFDRTKVIGSQCRNNPLYKQWRYKVWNRDNFKCRIGNMDCRGKIEAHHILGWKSYPELRYEINNGITLCHAHHPRMRAEEKRLASYFNGLVSVSKA